MTQIAYPSGTGFPLDTTGDILLQRVAAEQAAPALTDGSLGNLFPAGGQYYFAKQGTVQTFAFGGPVTINELDLYTAWNSDRVTQRYQVSVSADNGATFSDLCTVAADPGPLYNGSRAAVGLRVQLLPNGSDVLALGVDHIRFSFGNGPFADVAYTEIAVYGVTEALLTKPVITTDLPEAVTGEYTLPLILTVEATGNPAPTFQWYKDGNPISGAVLPTYTIPYVHATDAGRYHVVAQNSEGTANSVVCTVDVINPPEETYPILMDVVTMHVTFDPINKTNDLILHLIPDGYPPGK